MEQEQTPPLTDKKKVKVSNAQIADPGVHFFLETDDNSAFDSPLKIKIIVTDTVTNNQFQSNLHITNLVAASQLQLMIPFGDPNFTSGTNTAYSLAVDVRFTAPNDGSSPYDADPVNTSDTYYAGEFFDVQLITPLPAPPSNENESDE